MLRRAWTAGGWFEGPLGPPWPGREGLALGWAGRAASAHGRRPAPRQAGRRQPRPQSARSTALEPLPALPPDARAARTAPRPQRRAAGVAREGGGSPQDRRPAA